MKSSDQTPQSRIEFLRRFILIHSYLYYECDTSLVTDHFYDDHCKELVKLQKDHGCKGKFAKVYKDFDGSTGFDLYHRLSKKDRAYISGLAQRLLNYSKTNRAD